jgi:hypothetical protein
MSPEQGVAHFTKHGLTAKFRVIATIDVMWITYLSTTQCTVPPSSSISVTRAAMAERSERVSVTWAKSG